MAWGIPGNVGEIYRKQQSDELRDQLLKQEMAQRIRAFEAEQVYRQQQMAAQAEERAGLERDRQSEREYRSGQLARQTRLDTRDEETAAGKQRAISNIHGLVPLLQPGTPEFRTEAAMQGLRFAPQDALSELTKEPKPTEGERLSNLEKERDIIERTQAKYARPPQGPRPNYTWYQDDQGNVREAPEGTARPGERKYDPVATRQQEATTAAQQAVVGEAANTAEEIERLSNELLKHPGFNGAFGLYSSVMPTMRQETANAEILLDRIKGLLTLDNTGKLKGVLSDADMKILRQASTSLDARMGETAGAAELTRLAQVSGRAKERAAQQPQQPLRPKQDGVMTPSGGGEGAGPKVGDIKTFPNGKKGRFDGKGWELIQ